MNPKFTDTYTERAVLSAILANPAVFPQVLSTLGHYHESAFQDPMHHYVFHAMHSLFTDGQSIAVITIAERIATYDIAEHLSPIQYLAEISNADRPTTATVIHYTKIIERLARMRSLETLSLKAASLVAGEQDPDEIISELRQDLLRCEPASRQGLEHIRATIPTVLENLNAIRKAGSVPGSVYTGLPSLDKIIRGFSPGEYAVLAARPSVGKSALAANIAVHNAKDGKRVLFFSLEMSVESIIERLLSAEGGFNINEFKDGYGGTTYPTQLDNASKSLLGLPLYIHDGANLTWDELYSSVLLDIERNGKADVIIIDYLQLLSLKRRSNNQNRQDEVATISRQIKQLARATKCPVVALSQLSRAGDTDRPRLSHLRESGAIEQDADYAILMSRGGR